MEALLNAGADAEQANVFGDSPRTLADSAREEGRLGTRVHDLFRRRFYGLSKEAAVRRVNAVLRTEGLDVNADCGGGNPPLHYALQDSLTPLKRAKPLG